MSEWRQIWLVARREIRERSRSKAFWAGTALMLVVVVAAIVAPALVDHDEVTRDVGFSGVLADELPATVIEQGGSVDVAVRVHRYDDTSAGEEAVRDDEIDVLVVDARRLLWRGVDERLRAVVTGAIQLVALEERAAAAGITTDDLAALAVPVEVENEELGLTTGRGPDDEAAAYAMSVLLLLAMVTYGQLVLTGVVQEKSSRVVEVLLARMPARTLLAGKVTGIGLLGLGQFAVTALAALIATAAVDRLDIDAISAAVLAWVVAWFLLGYAFYAIAYGAFGSLASRTEDASSIAAPVNILLLVGYWASLIAVSADPEGAWARLVSLLPATAPFAMPGRIALGATAWWEPVLAAGLCVAAIAAVAAFAGRVYTGAILRSGASVRLRDAWRRTTTPHAPRAYTDGDEGRVTRRESTTVRATTIALLAALLVGGAAAALAGDVVVGVAIAAACYAVLGRIVKRTGHDDRHWIHR